MKIKDIDYIDLPREKLLQKGPDNLKDFELLAIMLRTGYKKKDVLCVSQEILDKHPLENLIRLSLDDLQQIKGIGKTKAASLLAAVELCKRALNKDTDLLPSIKKPGDTLPLLSYLKNRKKEYFVALFLNSRNQVLHVEEISVGTLNESIVHPRELFQPAIEHSSAGIILAHNHPSGDPMPSREDVEITKRICKAGELLGIELIDHLIITKKDLVSMKEKGYF